MSKSLSVKVETKKVIAALEATLAKKQDDYEKQDEAKEKYNKEVEKYNLAVIKLVKGGKGKITSASKHGWHRSRNGVVTISAEIDFPATALPAEPKEPNDIRDFTHQREVEEIQGAVRILKMSDQEYVNASTMKSVSQYL
jgi:predicted DNA-binding protein